MRIVVFYFVKINFLELKLVENDIKELY